MENIINMVSMAIAGCSLGLGFLALMASVGALYKASKAKEKAIELYKASCENTQRRVTNLEFETSKAIIEYGIEHLDQRLKALEDIKNSKKEK